MNSMVTLAITESSRVTAVAMWFSSANRARYPMRSIGFDIRMICSLPPTPSLKIFTLPETSIINPLGLSPSLKMYSFLR